MACQPFQHCIAQWALPVEVRKHLYHVSGKVRVVLLEQERKHRLLHFRRAVRVGEDAGEVLTQLGFITAQVPNQVKRLGPLARRQIHVQNTLRIVHKNRLLRVGLRV